MFPTATRRAPVYNDCYPAPPARKPHSFGEICAAMKDGTTVTLVGMDNGSATGRVTGIKAEGGKDIWLVTVVNNKTTATVCVKAE